MVGALVLAGAFMSKDGGSRHLHLEFENLKSILKSQLGFQCLFTKYQSRNTHLFLFSSEHSVSFSRVRRYGSFTSEIYEVNYSFTVASQTALKTLCVGIPSLNKIMFIFWH